MIFSVSHGLAQQKIQVRYEARVTSSRKPLKIYLATSEAQILSNGILNRPTFNLKVKLGFEIDQNTLKCKYFTLYCFNWYID